MAKAKKRNDLSADDIMTKYMVYTLEQDQLESDLYQFCEYCKIDEAYFYEYFSSLENVQKSIWNELMVQAIHTVKTAGDFEDYNNQEKLLSLFYTFFENLSLNRSYLLRDLGRNGRLTDKWALWKQMKETFGIFINEIFMDGRVSLASGTLKGLDTIRNKGLREGFWVQLLFLIDFWHQDESPGLEKTDIAIEKSVRAIMDLIDITPITSIVDFGKFVWKERIR